MNICSATVLMEFITDQLIWYFCPQKENNSLCTVPYMVMSSMFVCVH